MIEVYKFSQTEILTFILVLLRLSTFIVTWPVFGTTNVPKTTKVLLSLVLTMVMFPIVGIHKLDQQSLDQFYVWLLLREALIGVTMGFITRFFFFTISICAQVISDSVGLSSIQLLNPATEDRGTALEQFYTLMATLFFLGVNGHHVFIGGLVKSYEIVPLSLRGLNLEGYTNIAYIAQAVTVAGLKLAAPVMIAMFCMNIAMGIVGRAVPQINVLVTSMPVNILAGLFVMTISIPLLLTEMNDLLNMAMGSVFAFLKSF